MAHPDPERNPKMSQTIIKTQNKIPIGMINSPIQDRPIDRLIV